MFGLIISIFSGLLFITSYEAICPLSVRRQSEWKSGNIYPAIPIDDEFTVYSGTNPVVMRIENIHCNETYPYVASSGICNNLNDPIVGASFTQFVRVLPAAYSSDKFDIRKDANNGKLESERKIVSRISTIRTYDLVPTERFNHAAVMYALFVVKDISQNINYFPSNHDNQEHCCKPNSRRMLPEHLRRPGCYCMDEDGINDPFGTGCVEFIRTKAAFKDYVTVEKTQMLNPVTQYMDQSNIYGSTPATLRKIRLYRGGEMKNSVDRILPRHPECTGPKCFYAADTLAVLLPTLAIFHTIYLRLHNIFAGKLLAVNPHWDDERTYQETRRLATAVYQSINYNEWAPLALGVEAFRRNITCPPDQAYCGWYSDRVDASATEDGVNAFRALHLNMPMAANFYTSDYNQTRSIPMEEITHRHMPVLETAFLPLLRGMIADSGVYDTMPDFIRIFRNDNSDEPAFDVFAYDIGRARDYGLAPYVQYYEWCFQRQIVDWADLESDLAPTSIDVLKTLYVSVRDIDLHAGLMLEQKYNVTLGPVARCLIAEQLYRTKHGDRFFYSLPNGAYPFSESQLRSIQSLTFADALCLTTDIGETQAKAFEPLSRSNPLRPCAARTIDFQLWRDAEN